MQRISETATVGCKLPENCTIGDFAYIKATTLGDGTIIEKDSMVMKAVLEDFVHLEKRNLVRDATIGEMTYTGADTSIMWAHVGKFCSISRVVDIGGNEHNYHAATTMPEYKFKNAYSGKTVVAHHAEEFLEIGNDVWIGQGASIIRKPGLVVGHGAVIGTGAVVTKSVPPYAIVAGVPARIIGYRFDEKTIERLLSIQWWNWPREVLKENWQLLTKELDDEKLSAMEEIKAQIDAQKAE